MPVNMGLEIQNASATLIFTYLESASSAEKFDVNFMVIRCLVLQLSPFQVSEMTRVKRV